MAKKDEKAEEVSTENGIHNVVELPVAIPSTVIPSEARNLTGYQYIGDTVSSYSIAGNDILLAPGKTVEFPSNDMTVQKLVKQGILIPYKMENKRH